MSVGKKMDTASSCQITWSKDFARYWCAWWPIAPPYLPNPILCVAVNLLRGGDPIGEAQLTDFLSYLPDFSRRLELSG